MPRNDVCRERTGETILFQARQGDDRTHLLRAGRGDMHRQLLQPTPYTTHRRSAGRYRHLGNPIRSNGKTGQRGTRYILPLPPFLAELAHPLPSESRYVALRVGQGPLHQTDAALAGDCAPRTAHLHRLLPADDLGDTEPGKSIHRINHLIILV